MSALQSKFSALSKNIENTLDSLLPFRKITYDQALLFYSCNEGTEDYEKKWNKNKLVNPVDLNNYFVT